MLDTHTGTFVSGRARTRNFRLANDSVSSSELRHTSLRWRSLNWKCLEVRDVPGRINKERTPRSLIKASPFSAFPLLYSAFFLLRDNETRDGRGECMRRRFRAHTVVPNDRAIHIYRRVIHANAALRLRSRCSGPPA